MAILHDRQVGIIVTNALLLHLTGGGEVKWRVMRTAQDDEISPTQYWFILWQVMNSCGFLPVADWHRGCGKKNCEFVRQ